MIDAVSTPSAAARLSAGLVAAVRGSGRGGRATRTGLVSLASRSLSIFGTLITVPLVLNHFGPERYGVWMTLSVIFIYLKLADGGATIGLIALVSRADGAGDKRRIAALFDSAFALTLAVGLVLTGVAFAMPALDWAGLLKLGDPALARDAGLAAALIVLAMGFGYPSGFTRQGRLGLQQGAAANAWDLAATAATFAGQLAVVYLKFGIVMLAAVTAFTPVIVNAISSFAFYAGPGRRWLPRPGRASWPVVKSLFSSGSMFMLLTLTQALSVQIEPVMIARLAGVEAVASYSVVQKLFAQPQVLVTLFLVAQFPAYGEALTRGDDAWIVQHFRRSLIAATAIVIVGCGSLALLAQPLLALWIGDAIQPSTRLIACLAVYGAVATIANVFTYFFFALGLYRRVILAHAVMIAINIPLAILLIPRLGPEGSAIAISTGYLLALIGPSLYSIRSIIRELPKLRKKELENTGAIDETKEARQIDDLPAV